MLHVVSCNERTALYSNDKLLAYDKTDYLDSETIINLYQMNLLTEPIRYYWLDESNEDNWPDGAPESFAAFLPDLIDRTKQALGHD